MFVSKLYFASINKSFGMKLFKHITLGLAFGAASLVPFAAGQVNAASFIDTELSESFWNDPTFQRRFLGSYGVNSAVEPRFENPEEQIFYSQLGDVIRDDPKQAIKQLSSKITTTSSALLSYTLGSLNFQEGNHDAAIQNFTVALSKFPDFLRAHKNMGIVLVREGRYADAVNHLTTTINLGGADGTVYGLLGFCYLNTEKYQSAVIAYQNAMLLDAENQDWKLGMIKCKIANEELKDAVRLLDDILEEQPQSTSLWGLQANVYLQMEEMDKAAVNFEILRKSGHATLQNLMLLGDVYMMKEAKDLALDVYLEAIEMDGNGDVQRSLRAADIMVSRGEWEEASRLFAKIRTAHGTTMTEEENFKLLKMESKVAIANGNGQEALAVLEQIIEKNPLDGEALLMAGDFYSQNGDQEKAVFRYEMASKVSGFEADAWLKHAQILVRSQEYTKAIDLLERAQKSNPRDNVQKYLDSVQRVASAASK
jgi:tetratricopeptide (TPR) repeat protein